MWARMIESALATYAREELGSVQTFGRHSTLSAYLTVKLRTLLLLDFLPADPSDVREVGQTISLLDRLAAVFRLRSACLWTSFHLLACLLLLKGHVRYTGAKPALTR